MEKILLINKPKGVSSYAVVAAVRRRFGEKKVGHTGTLDPCATGLLIVLLGEATKEAQTFINLRKTYQGTFILGKQTDTFDAAGSVINKAEYKHVSKAKLKQVMTQFIGKFRQKPPIFSAIKVRGTPAYKLARQGKVVVLPKRNIEIYKFDLIKFIPPKVYFKVACSKGTYIRSLVNDVGLKLKTYAYLIKLKRLNIGKYSVTNAISPKMLKLELKKRQIWN